MTDIRVPSTVFLVPVEQHPNRWWYSLSDSPLVREVGHTHVTHVVHKSSSLAEVWCNVLLKCKHIAQIAKQQCSASHHASL